VRATWAAARARARAGAGTGAGAGPGAGPGAGLGSETGAGAGAGTGAGGGGLLVAKLVVQAADGPDYSKEADGMAWWKNAAKRAKGRDDTNEHVKRLAFLPPRSTLHAARCCPSTLGICGSAGPCFSAPRPES